MKFNKSIDPKVDLSIIIVNWNAEKYLKDCVESIKEQSGELKIQLILVDASSSDNSVGITKDMWPDAEIEIIPESLGYVKGNNVGLKMAIGRYSLILNSDTIIYDNALELMVRFLDAHPEVGVSSSKILNPDGSDQGVVRNFPSVMNGIFGRRSFMSRLWPNNKWYRHYMLSRNVDSEEAFETEILSACAMFLRTDLAQELEGLNEKYKFYWVDSDYCIRVKRAGYKVYCYPKAKIMHYEGEGGSTSTLKKKLQMNKAFNDGAYMAYCTYHNFGAWDLRRLLVWSILFGRMQLLNIIQILKPNAAVSSGGKN